ncbi:MAG: type 4a pilus biogenesis protein PilO [Syntrophobacteraceae bacterium]
MRKLTHLEKVGLVAGVVVAMSYFYLHKIYDPRAKALDRTTKELAKLSDELRAVQEVEPVFRLQGRLDAKKKELEDIEKSLAALVQPTDSPAALNALQHKIFAIADSCSLRITSVTPKGTLVDVFAWRVYWVEMLGGYNQFVAFLDALRELPLLVRVDRIRMTGEKDGRSIRIAMELKI